MHLNIVAILEYQKFIMTLLNMCPELSLKLIAI